MVEAVEAVRSRIDKLLSINGTRTVDSFHRELGRLMWDYCGMERTEEGLRKAIARIRELKAGVLVRRQGAGQRTRSSTRRWSGPAGSPTSSSSAS